MSQPKDFGFNEDQGLLKDSFRRFLNAKDILGSLRKTIVGTEDPYHGKAREPHFDRQIWQEMIALGWPGIAVPETHGGAGMNLLTAASLCEELGRVAIPTPLTATIHSTFLLREAQTDTANSALAAIAGGQPCSLAFQDATGSLEVNDTRVAHSAAGLNGTACYVQDAQKAGSFLVAARAAAGVGFYLVDAAGVRVRPDTIIDLTRDQGRIEFTNAAAVEIVPPGMAADVMRRTLPALLTLVAADIAGAAEWLLQTTAEYARVRTQFDRQIGFFQAVKHPIVNMMMSADETRSLVYNAACAYDTDPRDAMRCAHLAKSSAADTAEFCAGRAVQLHGGIGFTWEADIQIYFKRLTHNQFLYGDGVWQRQALAELI